MNILKDFERKSKNFWDFRSTNLEEKQSFKTSERDYLSEHVRDHCKNVRQKSDGDWPGNLLSFKFLKNLKIENDFAISWLILSCPLERLLISNSSFSVLEVWSEISSDSSTLDSTFINRALRGQTKLWRHPRKDENFS